MSFPFGEWLEVVRNDEFVTPTEIGDYLSSTQVKFQKTPDFQDFGEDFKNLPHSFELSENLA
ncbi:MAG TPA: hypothetical protein DEB39_02160 [Planctomycetaceae bacterium]|nr:hypothetical protein [Planctomycetaceae bacterium]